MKKPYLSEFERQLISCKNNDPFIELRYRWQYVKRDIDKSVFGKFLHKTVEWLDKKLYTSKSSCFLDVVSNNEALEDLLKWMKTEPAYNIDDVKEILEDYKYYKSYKSEMTACCNVPIELNSIQYYCPKCGKSVKFKKQADC